MNFVNVKDSGVNLAFIGRPGSGKSTLAIKMLLDLDPTFNVNRICHSIEEVLDLLVKGDPLTGKIIPGQAILLDEIINEEGAYARSALSRSNILFSYLFANFRAKRIIFGICLPKYTQLDKDIREVALHGLIRMTKIDFEKRKSYARFYWVSLNELQGTSKITLPRLVDRNKDETLKVQNVIFSSPPTEFIKEYKKKKMAYIEEKENLWLGKVVKDKEKTEKVKVNEMKEMLDKIRDIKYDLRDGNKFSKEKIMLHFNLPEFKARTLTKLATLKYGHPTKEEREKSLKI